MSLHIIELSQHQIFTQTVLVAEWINDKDILPISTENMKKNNAQST